MSNLISLNLFDGVHGTQPIPGELSLEELAEFLAPENPPFVTREERKLKQLFSMNIYKEGTTRGKDNVEFMTGVVFDFDNKNDYVSIGTVLNHVKDKRIAYAWYTTHSHTESRPKWRLVIPFVRPLPIAEWLSVYKQCTLMIGNPPGIDESACKDAAHMWFPPCKNMDQPYSADSDLEASFIDPLNISIHLSPEEQAHYEQSLAQALPQIALELSLPVVTSPQPKSDFSIGQAMSAVGFIKVESANYEQWLNIGMALHHQFGGEERAFHIWDLWSSQSEHYNREGLLKKWRSFNLKENAVGIGTLIRMAQQEGYDLKQENAAPLPSRHIIGLDVMDFIRKEIPLPNMLVDPIIPEQGITMLYAPRGIGKTYLSLSLAYIAAGGKSILDGKWIASQENKVVFVDGEMPAGRLQYRLKGLIRSVGPLSQRGLLTIITPDLQEMGIPDLSTPVGKKLIEEHLDGAKLLVLDNQSCLFRSGRENESASWDNIQEWFLDLRRRGISVLLIHHANKDGQQRGTSKKEDVMDTVIALRRPADYDPSEGARFEVHYEKARNFYGESAEPFEAQLKEQDDRYFWIVKELAEDSETQMIMELYQQGLNHRAISKQTGLSESTVYRKIIKLKKQETGGAI
jgi:putative DNA primase/helicase